MAKIELDPKYAVLADELVERFKERDIVLSDYAVGLLRLSVEAWYEDTPRARFRRVDSVDLRSYAEQIVEGALRDPHIMPRGRARYTDLLVALSESGKAVLQGIFDKGF